jgi:WD40 repeat protein
VQTHAIGVIRYRAGVRRDEITLSHPGPPNPKYVELAVQGTVLSRRWWTGAGKPRESTKSFDAEYEAQDALEKETRAKMRDGFVFRRPVDEAKPGELLFQCVVRGTRGDGPIDMHPDGHTLAIGVTLDDPRRVEINTIDIRTGARRLVHKESGRVGRGEVWLHAVAYNADGSRMVFSVNGETRELILDSGEIRVLAVHDTSTFNPFFAQLCWDAARERLLVFDKDRIRVLDADGKPLFDLPVGERSEFRTAALSPSGRLMALTFGDLSQVEIWDVDSGRQVLAKRFPFPSNFTGAPTGIRRLGFDPAQRLLVAGGDYLFGWFAMAVDSGELRWAVADSLDTERYEYCNDWAYSPAGTIVASGSPNGVVTMFEAATMRREEPTYMGGWPFQVGPVVFSRDGALLLIGDYTGRVSVHKVAGVG